MPAATHQNALTIKLRSPGIPFNLSQGCFSSSPLDQAILWSLSETDLFSSSSNRLTHPAGTKWILEKASRTCRQMWQCNEWAYPEPSDGCGMPTFIRSSFKNRHIGEKSHLSNWNPVSSLISRSSSPEQCLSQPEGKVWYIHPVNDRQGNKLITVLNKKLHVSF